jgi:hypothetical protein
LQVIRLRSGERPADKLWAPKAIVSFSGLLGDDACY